MDYRLNVLNSFGQTTRVEEWVCTSDVEAIDRASTYVSSFGRELWQGDRHISSFAGPMSRPEGGTQPNA